MYGPSAIGWRRWISRLPRSIRSSTPTGRKISTVRRRCWQKRRPELENSIVFRTKRNRLQKIAVLLCGAYSLIGVGISLADQQKWPALPNKGFISGHPADTQDVADG